MAAERQLADMEAAATAAGDAAAFENSVLRRQVADLRKAAHEERQVAPRTQARSCVRPAASMLLSAAHNPNERWCSILKWPELTHAVQVLTQQHKGALTAVQRKAEEQIAALERGAERAAQDATAACQQLCHR